MHFSTFANSLLAISVVLLGASAIPQPDLPKRQQSTPLSPTASSTFTSTITSQCYTSRLTTQLTLPPTTTSSTSFTSAQSTVAVRTTSPITPRARTATTTSTASVTSTITNSNGTISTTTVTSTRIQTTTSFTTRTTGTTSTSTLSTTTTTTIPAPSGFSPVSSTLPRPTQALKRLISFPLPLLNKRQRGSRPRTSLGRNRPRSYPGDISCLTLLATGTITTRTQTIRSTLPTSTTTTTKTTTTTLRTTIFPPSQPTPQTTITQSTTTTSLIIFTRTTVQTTTDILISTSTSTSSIYAACTDPANRLSKLPSYNNRPINGIEYDYATSSGNSTSPYACCVSTVMNPSGAIWAWSVKDGCLVLAVDGAAGTCAGGQGAQGAGRSETVYVGQVGGVEEFTVGNGYCGAWDNVVMNG